MRIASRGGTTMVLTIALAAGAAVASEGADLGDVKARGALRVIIAADESPPNWRWPASAWPASRPG
jgi:hypothetical protein